MFALWLIGLGAQAGAIRVSFGSRTRAAATLSIISLARWWLEEPAHRMIHFRKKEGITAFEALENMAWRVKI